MHFSTGTYTVVVRLLATICHGAPGLALTLLQEGIASILQGVLVGNTSGYSGFVISMQYLMGINNKVASVNSTLSRSPQQYYEILSFINELLPRLPPGRVLIF